MNALGLISISIGDEATVDGRRLQKFLGGFFFFFFFFFTQIFCPSHLMRANQICLLAEAAVQSS